MPNWTFTRPAIAQIAAWGQLVLLRRTILPEGFEENAKIAEVIYNVA